jgi:hypothetical protein
VDASIEARGDTDGLTAARAGFWDRSLKRPAVTVRRLSASWTRNRLTLDLGKQFIRWGKTDVIVPTDRFAPRDYMEVVQTELLAVTAARLSLAFESGSFEVVLAPRLTPSRPPLVDRRWVVLPPEVEGLQIIDDGVEFPNTPQVGARWSALGGSLEYSMSVFHGHNHLPDILVVGPPDTTAIHVSRRYPQLTSVGGDAALPLPWFTVKAEAAWLSSRTAGTDEYALYVVQMERQVGEWLFIAGYAGEVVTTEGAVLPFAPDRGLARAIVGRASYTIDTNRSVVLEAVARQNGEAFLGRFEFSQAMGDDIRVTAAVRIIRGDPGDFLGQYHRNSSATVALRYSF